MICKPQSDWNYYSRGGGVILSPALVTDLKKFWSYKASLFSMISKQIYRL